MRFDPRAHALQLALHDRKIRQREFGLHNLKIADRIQRALNMRDIGCGKAADHMSEGIDLPDVGEELIAQALPTRGSAD